MADLTTGRRKSLPSSTFGLPGERKYPMPDRSHAANAKARASQQYNAGRLSGSEKAEIDRKANAKLGKSAGGYVPNPMAEGRPHMHALSMAAATHLSKMGHISPAQSAAIHAKSRAAMNGGAQPQPMAFGSLAPAFGRR